jgi:hypothetical protein
MEKSYVKVSDPNVIAKASITQSNIDKLTKASPLSLRDRRVVNIDPTKVSELSLRIDRPATTQPTSRPAEQIEYQIDRRKENLMLGPMLPTPPATPTTSPSPATKPSASSRFDIISPFLALAGEVSATAPTTQPANVSPATGPATQVSASPSTQPVAAPVLPIVPPPPASKWVLQSQGGTAADDDQVKDLLDALHPLKVEKYLESAPTTQPVANYILTVKTIGAGGADTATYELQITDPGGEAKLIGHYNDLAFELDRSILKKLDGDFKTKRPPEPVSTPPSFQGGGGFPPGGFNPSGG